MGMKSEKFIEEIEDIANNYIPKLQGVLVDVAKGDSFPKACEKWGINASWVRRIIYYGEREFDVPKVDMLKDTEFLNNWKELFLYELFDNNYIPVCNDFDEIYDIWMGYLSEIQVNVLNSIYKQGITITDTAEEMGVSKQRVSQIKLRALKTLRNPELLMIYVKGVEYYKENKRINSVLEKGYTQGIDKNKKLEKAIDDNIVARRIEQSGLDVGICSLLKSLGINRVGDLLQYTYTELYNIKGIGVGRYNDIIDFLNKNDLELREDVERNLE